MNERPQTLRKLAEKGQGQGVDRNWVLIGMAVAFGLAAGTIVFWPDSEGEKPIFSEPAETSAEPAPEKRVSEAPETTAQEELAAENAAVTDAAPGEDSTGDAVSDSGSDLNVPFEIEEVASALSSIELDEDGMAIIDDSTREILNAAFMRPSEPMTREELKQLQMMIETGLQGDLGDRASEIAGRFHSYSREYREVEDTLDTQGGGPDALQANFEQISNLRRAHLGDDLAEQIFGQEEALTRYTLEAMEIQNNPDLTPEERARQQEELMDSTEGLRDAGFLADPETDSATDQEQAD